MSRGEGSQAKATREASGPSALRRQGWAVVACQGSSAAGSPRFAFQTFFCPQAVGTGRRMNARVTSYTDVIIHVPVHRPAHTGVGVSHTLSTALSTLRFEFVDTDASSCSQDQQERGDGIGASSNH